MTIRIEDSLLLIGVVSFLLIGVVSFLLIGVVSFRSKVDCIIVGLKHGYSSSNQCMEMPMSKDGTPSLKYAGEIFVQDGCVRRLKWHRR